MNSTEPIIAWRDFDFAPTATRRDVLLLGRAACRHAWALAVERWITAHGPAPWVLGELDHEPSGAPVVRADGAPMISFCHARGLAGCAIATPTNSLAGIDAERADAPAMNAVRSDSERSGESGLPWPLHAHHDWPARLWCAKEACVKAERTPADLAGRTLRAVELAEPTPNASTLDLIIRTHKGRLMRVRTDRRSEFITAAVLSEER